MGSLEPMRVGKCELTTKLTQLRQLQNVVTLEEYLVTHIIVVSQRHGNFLLKC